MITTVGITAPDALHIGNDNSVTGAAIGAVTLVTVDAGLNPDRPGRRRGPVHHGGAAA
jgi:hypothetical protein